MQRDTSLIVDESGIEVLVTYEWENSPIEREEGHGYHIVGGGLEVDLESVEIVIKGGNSIDILPLLTEKQKDSIIDQLPIYE